MLLHLVNAENVNKNEALAQTVIIISITVGFESDE